jgi:hypothetical protein
MLNAIFGSASRVKLLNLFLLYPEKKYRLPVLAVDLGRTAGAVRRELDNLIKFGLIKEEKLRDAAGEKKSAGEKKYFSADSNFILYPEIRALFVKAQILFSQKFLDGLQKICRPKFLALTGLFTNYPEAQTDLLIVGSLRRPAFLKLIKGLEKDLGREINFTIFSEREFRYRQGVMDIFLYNIMEGKILILIDNLNHDKNA